ncbi:MAG: tyrosine-type recombinase/integrase [Selenomonadaceae bacterium]
MRLPNGYGSVHKLSGKRRKPWAVMITTGCSDEGKFMRKYIGYYPSRPDAIKALADYNENPYDIESHDITFAKLFDKWCDDRYTKKGDSIPNSYTAAFARAEKLHDMPFVDIRARHIQGEIDRCALGYSTKKNIRILCNLLSKYAISIELISTNYTPLTTLPTEIQSRIHKPFTLDEIETLWRHTDDAGAVFALIYCYTGLRPTELLKIKTENVYLDERYMLGGLKTSAGINRMIPIAEKIFPFIKAMYTPESEYLAIDSRDGKPIATYDRLRAHYWEISPVLKKMDHLPHDGRHTCATLLDNAHVEKLLIQKILGHKAKNITDKVYTHKTLKQLLDAINRI